MNNVVKFQPPKKKDTPSAAKPRSKPAWLQKSMPWLIVAGFLVVTWIYFAFFAPQVPIH